MISPRPWHLMAGMPTNVLCDAMYRVARCDFDGNAEHAECSENAVHIIACVNAFYESGLDPADLPKFVEAVRAWHKYLPTIANKQPGVQEWISLVHHGNEAAACLPDNKGKP